MGHDPAADHDSDSDEPPRHSRSAHGIGAHHDVIHIAGETRHDDKRDVHHQECEKAEHGEEVDRARRLSSAEDLRVPGEPIHYGR